MLKVPAGFQPKNILVIKIRAMGDTLLATPALRALRYAYPQARITVMVSPLGKTVLTRNPHISDIRIYDKGHGDWRYGWRQLGLLHRNSYDLVLALHASFRTGLLARATGARFRVVHNHSGRNFFSTIPITERKESKSAIERDLDAVRALGLTPHGTELVFPLEVADYEHVQTILLMAGISTQDPFWVLVPGAGKTRKQWTAPAMAAFLTKAQQRIRGKWLVLAGPQEQELVKPLEKMPQSKLLILSLGIHHAAALMALAQGVVTADSGPKHVAVAVGARTLTLWTDEPEAEWHPYDLGQHALVRSHSGLVADITAEEVLNALVRHFGQ